MCGTSLLSVSNEEHYVRFYIKVYCSSFIMLEFMKYCKETASKVRMCWNIIKRVNVLLHVVYS
jgi:hypothetical protein